MADSKDGPRTWGRLRETHHGAGSGACTARALAYPDAWARGQVSVIVQVGPWLRLSALEPPVRTSIDGGASWPARR